MGQFTEEELDIFMELLNDSIRERVIIKRIDDMLWTEDDEKRLQQLIALQQKTRKVEAARE